MCAFQLCRESLILPQRYHCVALHLSAKATSLKHHRELKESRLTKTKLTLAAGTRDPAVFQEHTAGDKGRARHSRPQAPRGPSPSAVRAPREAQPRGLGRGPGLAAPCPSLRLPAAPWSPGSAHPVPPGSPGRPPERHGRSPGGDGPADRVPRGWRHLPASPRSPCVTAGSGAPGLGHSGGCAGRRLWEAFEERDVGFFK